MRKKKTLKVSINEIKKYCPFVKNIQFLYKNNENKNNVVLSVMSDLCPIGKAINEKHLIIIDNKSKINIFKVLKESNVETKNILEHIKKNKLIEKKDSGDVTDMNTNLKTENKHGVCPLKMKLSNGLITTEEAYQIFQNECNNDLKGLINKLFLDKRYRIFTILSKYRKNYPKVFIENNRLNLPIFYEFYQKYGYKSYIGNTGYKCNYPLFSDSQTVFTDTDSNNNNILMISDEYSSNLSNLQKSTITDDQTVVWCSNDYLCLSNNQNIIDVGIETLRKIGNSSGGTRNISGSLLNHTHLEYILAKWYNKESALLFTSGYIANVGALQTIGKLLNLIFVSDELNHASIINGIRESQCEKYIFKHNDMNDLENILRNLRMKKEYENRKIMIVFESIYSMTGDISDMKEIIKLSRKYKALTYIDEVHAVGLYGKKGSGYLEELNLCKEIDIINGTLSKAIGSLGGFICANKYYIDVIRSYSPHFIFTTSLTPVNITTSAEAIYIIQNDISLRNKLHKVVKKTKEKLIERGIQLLDNNSHIIVILVKCAEKCKKICDDLLKEHNIYLQPINYPTVPKGSERLRITPSPFHTDEHISKLVDSLYILFKKYEVNIFDNKNKQKVEMKL